MGLLRRVGPASSAALLVAAAVGCGPNASLGTHEAATSEGAAGASAVLGVKPRLIVLADLGGDGNEEQQVIHLLLYSNEFDVEGLIATTGKYQRQSPQPEGFSALIDGYAQVVESLRLHAVGFPDPANLRAVVRAGQAGFGAEAVGAGMSSPGSELLIQALTAPDPRPLHLAANGGSNTLAQALFDYSQSHTPAELVAFVAKLRVYENGSQDEVGALLNHEYPDLVWKRSNYQTYGWAGKQGGPADVGPYTWEPYSQDVTERAGPGQHEWAREHIQTNHGALGALYPNRLGGNGFIEGGGISPWIGLANKGLCDPEEPAWGGWGGRFSRTRAVNYWSRYPEVQALESSYEPFAVFPEASDRWTDPETNKTYEDLAVPVYRFRRAMFNDLKGRMDWCVSTRPEANHNPIAALNGDTTDTTFAMSVAAGEVIRLDASASRDPDGDPIELRWYPYPEAGTYSGDLAIPQANSAVIDFQVPLNAPVGSEIHLVLEVKDRSPIVAMFDYRRVVLTVRA